MKNTIATLLLIIPLIGMAQQQLNDYKYIIVPKQFAEFKRENQYQTSTLVKHLFIERGFEAVYDDALPQELRSNGCLGLRVKMLDNSSMFTTKASVNLTNCNEEEIFVTKEGKSKEKDYKDSYGEALREAFKSFDAMNYAYNGKAENAQPLTVSMKNDIKSLPKESRETRASVNQPNAMVEQEATLENQRYVDRRPVTSNFKKAESKDNTPDKMAEQIATQEQQSYVDRSPKESDFKKASAVSPSSTEKVTQNEQNKDLVSDLSSVTLYAQELSNGYQLVDSTPKIRMKMEKTSMPDFYLTKAGETSGTVFKKNDVWFFEYYSGDDLITQELNIKF